MPRASQTLYRGLLLYALVAGIIGNLAMLARVGHPWGGFLTQWQQQDQAALIIPGNSPSAPGLQSSALQRGDIIRSADGISLRRRPLPQIQETLYASGVRTVTYDVQRGSQQLTLQGPLLLFGLQDLVEARAVYILLALAVWLLGWIVLSGSSASASNRAFAVFAAAAVMMVLPGNFYFNYGRRDVAGVILTMATAIAFAPLFGAAATRFALAFPKDAAPRWGWAVYVPAVMAIVLHEYASANTFNSTRALNAIAQGVTFFNVAFAALGLGLLLVRCLGGMLHRSTGPRIRHQLSLVLLGFACGVLLPGLPYGIYLLRADAYHVARALDQPLIAFLFPAAIGYAILRYQIFPGRSRALFTLIMLAVGATLAQLVSLLLAALAPGAALGRNTLVAVVIAISLLTSLFWQGEGGLPRILKRLLRRDETHYRALSNLLVATGPASTTAELAPRITARLALDFSARYVDLWLVDETGTWTLVHRHAAEAAVPPAGTNGQAPPLSSTSVTLLPDPCLPLRSRSSETAELAAVVPLAAPAGGATPLLGVLVLGAPGTGDIYDERDLPLLSVIGQQVAAALVTAQRVDHLKREPQRILAEVERERERIARELHDTVQQEMGALPYLLESLQSEVADSPQLQRRFDKCYAAVGRMSLELRNLRHDISPPELWSGDYTEALRELVLRKLTQSGLDCAFEGSLPAQLNRGQATAIYRICQQAFDNVLQHACAKRVRVKVCSSAADHQVRIRIEDDGCGFDVTQLSRLVRDGHAGVTGMRERAEVLGGTLELTSHPGQGTAVEVRLPLTGSGS